MTGDWSMSILKKHVTAITCDLVPCDRTPFREVLHDQVESQGNSDRTACRPENFTKAGFFYLCRQSALADSHHGRTQDSGRYRKTNCSVENLIQVSPQARVTVMSHSTLPDECIRPAHLGFVNLHCRRSDPRMDHPA